MSSGKTIAEYTTAIKIKPRYTSSFETMVEVVIVKKTHKTTKLDDTAALKNVLLADPTFDTPGPIDIILGVDIYTQIIMSDIIKLGPGKPIAQRTELG